MDEDVFRRTIAIFIKASKLTARCFVYVLWAIAKHHRAKQASHGKQVECQLVGHGDTPNSIEVKSPKNFERVVRCGNVDYAFYKTGQAEAITACFSEYSRQVLKRSKS